MTNLLLLVLAAVGAMIAIRTYNRQQVHDVEKPRQSQRIARLWEYFEMTSRRQNWDAAERSLLQILKYDHKNTAAYNQLGMMYVRAERFDDAIACFDIASSLAPSVASLYNLGLVHFRVGNYQEAASALQKVVDLEPTSKRMLVFARVLQQLGEYKKVVDVLKRTVDMDPNERNLAYLAEAYDDTKQYKKAEEVRQQLQQTRQEPAPTFSSEQLQTLK